MLAKMLKFGEPITVATYIPLVTVAVKHVLDEVLDHDNCNSHNCTS